MYERRRYARFRIVGGWKGTLRLLQDLALERYADGELWALSTVPARRDDVLAVEMTGGNDGLVTVTARVVATEPVPSGGTVRHRLRLAVLNQQHDFGPVAVGDSPMERAVPERHE